jgi:hypothetical protein
MAKSSLDITIDVLQVLRMYCPEPGKYQDPSKDPNLGYCHAFNIAHKINSRRKKSGETSRTSLLTVNNTLDALVGDGLASEVNNVTPKGNVGHKKSVAAYRITQKGINKINSRMSYLQSYVLDNAVNQELDQKSISDEDIVQSNENQSHVLHAHESVSFEEKIAVLLALLNSNQVPATIEMCINGIRKEREELPITIDRVCQIVNVLQTEGLVNSKEINSSYVCRLTEAGYQEIFGHIDYLGYFIEPLEDKGVAEFRLTMPYTLEQLRQRQSGLGAQPQKDYRTTQSCGMWV